MSTLRDIRQRIVSVKNTSKITSAMKMVSAAKMKRAQNAIESARPYFSKLEDMVAGLVANAGADYTNPLIKSHEDVRNIAIILISADRGLCGSFNTNLYKTMNVEIKEKLGKQYPHADLHFIPVGKKSVSYVKKMKYQTGMGEFAGVFAALNFDDAQQIVSTAVKAFYNGSIDRVYVMYNQFVSVIKHTPALHCLLPVEAPLNIEDEGEADYIFEPSKPEILDVLLPKLVDIIIWRAMLESNAAEQAARMIAMEKATTNAKDLIRSLELQYNKARQAAITTEMLEIVSGAEALRSA